MPQTCPVRVIFPDAHLPAMAVLSACGEEGLDRPYQWQLEVSSDYPIRDMAALRGERCSLILGFRHSGAAQLERRFHGLVLAISCTHSDSLQHRYAITLAQPLASLSYQHRSRAVVRDCSESEGVDHGFTTPEMIEEVLREHGISGEEMDRSQLREEYSQRDYVVQYEESDLDFCQRWWQREGISHRVVADQRRECMVFIDHPGGYGQLDPALGTLPQALPGAVNQGPYAEGLIDQCVVWDRQLVCRPVSAAVVVRDHNWRRPEARFEHRHSCEHPILGSGERIADSMHVKTDAEARHAARLLAEREQAVELRLQGNCPALAPGLRFFVAGTRAPGSADWVVVAMQHELRQERGDDGQWECFYQHRLRAIPGDRTYRPPERTPWPQVRGTMPAMIHATDAEDARRRRAAPIDADGRYLVRVPFWRITDRHSDAPPSRRIRLLQFAPGGDGGLHFTIGSDSEVALVHHGGDPDRPLIAGTLPDRSRPSVVTGSSADANRWRTTAGHRLDWCENDGDESFSMVAAKGSSASRWGSGIPAHAGDGDSQFTATVDPRVPAPMAASSANHAGSSTASTDQRQQDVRAAIASIDQDKPRWAKTDQPRVARSASEVRMGDLPLTPMLRQVSITPAMEALRQAGEDFRDAVHNFPRQELDEHAGELVEALAQSNPEASSQLEALATTLDNAIGASESIADAVYAAGTQVLSTLGESADQQHANASLAHEQIDDPLLTRLDQ
ncbi:MAG: type VI secretion system tip protein VgrG, partial [Planctomycetota bacterium]